MKLQKLSFQIKTFFNCTWSYLEFNHIVVVLSLKMVPQAAVPYEYACHQLTQKRVAGNSAPCSPVAGNQVHFEVCLCDLCLLSPKEQTAQARTKLINLRNSKSTTVTLFFCIPKALLPLPPSNFLCFFQVNMYF